MKRALIVTNLFWLSFAIASGVFSANVLHRTADPVVYRRSVNEPDFPTSNWFHDPDISAVQSVPRKYWRRPLTNPVTEMTGPEKAVVDAQLASAEANVQKARAKQTYETTDQQGRVLRAVVVLTVDELNALRTWTRDFKTLTAASANYSAFATAVSTLPTLNNRTYAQAKTAIESAVDSE
jgi:hypothetical protein